MLQTNYNKNYLTTISNIPIELSFVDNDIIIRLRKSTYFIEFIKLNNLKVNLRHLKDLIASLETTTQNNTEELEKLKNNIEQLKKLCQETT